MRKCLLEGDAKGNPISLVIGTCNLSGAQDGYIRVTANMQREREHTSFSVGTVAQEDLPGHLKDSCSSALVLCSFKDSSCKHRCPKWAMAQHVEESVKLHLAMMCALLSWQWQEQQDLQQELEELSVGSDGVLIWKTGSYGRVGTVAQEDLPGHLKDSCSSALVLCSFKDSSCKHRCPKWAMAQHVEESVKLHLAMMCALLSWQWQEQQDLQQELEELSVGSDGVLIWKTGSYGRQLQEAKAKPNLECFSPAFYTHKCGYKLQVSAFLNGKGSGEGTRLSLYVDLLPGAFDNLLEWSFARRVTFCLLDQSDSGLAKPQQVTETFHPGPNWKHFQKPGTWGGSLDESSLGFGYPKFISHQDIQKRKTMCSVGNRSWDHQGLKTSDRRDCLPSWFCRAAWGIPGECRIGEPIHDPSLWPSGKFTCLQNDASTLPLRCGFSSYKATFRSA
ncbi:PREDICTED: TNF receptor-associated factor 4-like [Rhinopithecus bieti]|uniref:TNF receptor-associated factor 4-like n=1 Tax=Rhinopithecus bieti TaxID=61621 RepID=UPI00083BFE2F|nr:PREDICTED: TNF receptor-associated factor 4-like [Rhinopithecus bieti]